jgi:protein Mpv17
VVRPWIPAPLAHTYYVFQDTLIPSSIFGKWWLSALVKVVLDQTFYVATYNTVFFCGIGALRGDRPKQIFADIKREFWHTMKAGWKLWPLVHCITYTAGAYTRPLLSST